MHMMKKTQGKRDHLRRLSINVFLLLVSLFLSFLVFELVLSSGLLDGEDVPHPVWIPKRFRDMNRAIVFKSFERAYKHFNLFNFENDIFERDGYGSIAFRKKKPGTKRIAVLGDSVVWGNGLPYEDIWSIKLGRKLEGQYGDVEVLSWGRSGWDTVDYFNYLAEMVTYFENRGTRLDLDLLIIGHFRNDTNMRFEHIDYLEWHKSKLFAPFKSVFPNTYDFLVVHINRLLTKYILTDIGVNAYERKNLGSEHLEVYRKLLGLFSEYCDLKGIPLLFVLTPGNISKENGEMHEKVIPLLEETGIEYMDLYPISAETFKGHNPRKLRANPANGHPGSMLTELFAETVKTHLVENGFFSGSAGDAGPKSSAEAREKEILKELFDFVQRQEWRVGAYVVRDIKDIEYGYISQRIGYEHKGGTTPGEGS
jgi:hypothetical protein